MKSLSQAIMVGVLVNLLFAKGSSGLKCFTCDNCKEIPNIKAVDCGIIDNTCYKLDVGDTVMRACTRKELCSLKDIQKVFPTWLNSLISRENEKNNNGMEINCCDTDSCNNGPSLTVAFSLLAFGIATIFFCA